MTSPFPLAPKPFVRLPPGSIRARGWLLRQLRLAAAGLTGRMMDIWEDVGPHSAWLGGDGEAWERGPYFVRGLLSLAHALHDEALLQRAAPWVDWSLEHQQENGCFGPSDSHDWWPRMPMLDVLRLHFSATGDTRVPPFLQRYFAYQRRELPRHPLSFWAKPRGGDNLESVFWLYELTADPSLLELADLLHAQTSDWIGELGGPAAPNEEFDFGHGVNRAMGLKEPALHWRRSHRRSDLDAVRIGWEKTLAHHGQIQGTFSGDEFLHGTGSTQGTELCTIVELLSSLQTVLEVGGEMWAADAMERIAFNALPAILSADLCGHQYYQLPNQIRCTADTGNFWVSHGTDLLFGPVTGYGCCAANLHMGWPHLAHHLWYATADKGLAAVLFAPSTVTAEVRAGHRVHIEQETDYPFDTTVHFVVRAAEPVSFPLCFRRPRWATSCAVAINGIDEADRWGSGNSGCDGGLARVDRVWRDGDTLTVRFPESLRLSRWERSSAAIERGPLVFALPVGEDWRPVAGTPPFCDNEVHPTTPWNYALALDPAAPAKGLSVQTRPPGQQPWTAGDAPVRLQVAGRKIPSWTSHNGVSGPIPEPPLAAAADLESLTLVPFGCARLRVSMFPLLDR